MAGMSTEQLVAFVRQIFPRLDQLSYYDLLGVPSGSDQAAVRTAFYRLAADLHPDRYHTLADRALKEQLEDDLCARLRGLPGAHQRRTSAPPMSGRSTRARNV